MSACTSTWEVGVGLILRRCRIFEIELPPDIRVEDIVTPKGVYLEELQGDPENPGVTLLRETTDKTVRAREVATDRDSLVSQDPSASLATVRTPHTSRPKQPAAPLQQEGVSDEPTKSAKSGSKRPREKTKQPGETPAEFVQVPDRDDAVPVPKKKRTMVAVDLPGNFFQATSHKILQESKSPATAVTTVRTILAQLRETTEYQKQEGICTTLRLQTTALEYVDELQVALTDLLKSHPDASESLSACVAEMEQCRAQIRSVPCA